MTPLYLLFSYNEYYPSGGMHDLVGVYPTLEEAESAWSANGADAHIALIHNGKVTIVSSGYSNFTARMSWTKNQEPEAIAARLDAMTQEQKEVMLAAMMKT